MKTNPFILAVFTAFGINSLNPAIAIASDFLNDQQIKATLIGNSVQHASNDNESAYTVFYPSYGILIGAAGPWGIFKDKGRWSVSNGLYCAQWEQWQDNQTLCYHVKIRNNKIHWIAQQDKREIIDQLIPGNPGDLN